MSAAGTQATEPALFEAVIVPHRSLSPRGLRWLIGVLCTLSCTTGTVLFLLGAWPVVGFTGAELLLVVLLLRLNAQAARATELVLLRPSGLSIIRTDRKGKRTERVLAADWLRVTLDERPGAVLRLLVGDRSGATEIGASLGEDEKRDLADALRQALHRRSHPDFDNPQLR